MECNGADPFPSSRHVVWRTIQNRVDSDIPEDADRLALSVYVVVEGKAIVLIDASLPYVRQALHFLHLERGMPGVSLEQLKCFLGLRLNFRW